jgi:homocysteine S-methyltransferase
MTDALDRWLAREPFVVSDGGLATELAARGHDLGDPLWSARVLLDDPGAIEQLHLDYFRAGAELATTASYQASLPGLRARGLDDAAARQVLRSSVELATRARACFMGEHGGPSPMVVASLGSYGAVLADGSEYTGALGSLADAELVAFHRARIEMLADGVDLLAFETISSEREAAAIVAALAEVSAPRAWVSFACRDDRRLGSGDAIEACARTVAACDRVAAIGINCTAPTHVLPLLQRIAAITDRPLVAYPNAGEHYDARARSFGGEAIDVEGFAALALRWHAAGARVIGGCCRTGCAHVRALVAARQRLREGA